MCQMHTDCLLLFGWQVWSIERPWVILKQMKTSQVERSEVCSYSNCSSQFRTNVFHLPLFLPRSRKPTIWVFSPPCSLHLKRSSRKAHIKWEKINLEIKQNLFLIPLYTNYGHFWLWIEWCILKVSALNPQFGLLLCLISVPNKNFQMRRKPMDFLVCFSVLWSIFHNCCSLHFGLPFLTYQGDYILLMHLCFMLTVSSSVHSGWLRVPKRGYLILKAAEKLSLSERVFKLQT